jgi:hypothetical protein
LHQHDILTRSMTCTHAAGGEVGLTITGSGLATSTTKTTVVQHDDGGNNNAASCDLTGASVTVSSDCYAWNPVTETGENKNKKQKKNSEFTLQMCKGTLWLKCIRAKWDHEVIGKTCLATQPLRFPNSSLTIDFLFHFFVRVLRIRSILLEVGHE